jgi:hypothetical protein
MAKSLYFSSGSNDALLVPAERVGRIVKSHLANTLNIYIDSASRVGDPQLITLNVSAGKGTEAVRDINNALKNSRDGVIVIADNVSGASLSENIISVATSLNANIYPST